MMDDQEVIERLRPLKDQVPPNLEGNHVFSESHLTNAGIDFWQALEVAHSIGGGLAPEPNVPTQLRAGQMVERVDEQPERQIQIPQQALSD